MDRFTPPIRTVADYERDRMYQDAIDRATGSGAHGVPGTGPHFHMGHVITGVAFAFATWIVAPRIGLHEFVAFPALIVGIVAAGLFTNRLQSRSRGQSPPRARRQKRLLFFVVTGALSSAALGAWFAASEGDIPILQAAVTFAIIGAVFGLIVGGIVRLFRAATGRRAS